MKEANCYQSNRQMKKHGRGLGFCAVSSGAQMMEEQVAEALYISDVFDCGESSGTWDELHLHFEHLWELQVSVWIFDTDIIVEQLHALSIQDQYHVIKQNGFTQSCKDILLYAKETQQVGRYLVFAIHVRKPKRETLYFIGYELSFPAILFSEYLPALYQNNPTLERYLSIFKDIYLQLEKQIDYFYEQLDLQTCDEVNAFELLEWIGCERYLEYSDLSHLRRLENFFQHSYQKGSYLFYHHFFRFLFDEEMKLVRKDSEFHIYVRSMNHNKEKKIQLFFNQEFPSFVSCRLHFVYDAYFDRDAYMNTTAVCNDEKWSMDNASFHQEKLYMR